MLPNEAPIYLLIVDDHQMILDGISGMLADRNDIKILAQANNGQEALDWLTHSPQKPDIVISDISMPIMSGTELCRELKTNFSEIKVLILSMYNSISMVREAVETEADGFILKNAGREELLLAIHRIADGGTYFSQDIIPILYGKYRQEKKLDTQIKLTDREKEILKLIVAELTSDEIAAKLFISKKTVDNHRHNLLSKTNSKSTIGLVKFALEHDLA